MKFQNTRKQSLQKEGSFLFFGTSFGRLVRVHQSANPSAGLRLTSLEKQAVLKTFNILKYSNIQSYFILNLFSFCFSFFLKKQRASAKKKNPFSFMRMRKRIVFITTFQNKKFSNDCWTLKRVDDIQNSVRQKHKIMNFSKILSFFDSLAPKKKQSLRLADPTIQKTASPAFGSFSRQRRSRPAEKQAGRKVNFQKKWELVEQYFCFLFLKTYQQFYKKRKQKSFVRSCKCCAASHKRKLRSKRVCE